MTNQDEMIKLIKSISGQANILTIPRVYIGFTKSHRAALFLSQCVYWSDRSRLHDGWFYKSFREWNEELGLNQHAVETCVKTLKAGEWLQTKIETVQTSPTTFYRAVLVKIAESIRIYLEEPYIAETAKYEGEHLAEAAKLIQRKTISPSIKQKLYSETTGVDHKDFSRACEILNASFPADYALAGPVLLEADEHPNRLRIKLASVPPGFMDSFKSALDQVTRKQYRLEFETPATGNVHPRAPKPDKATDCDPVEVEEELGRPLSKHNQLTPVEAWQATQGELSLEMTRATFETVIKPLNLLSVNGTWKLGVKSSYDLEWVDKRLKSTITRILSGVVGEPVKIEFVEMTK